MRTLFIVVAVLAALYTGYWFAASSQIEARAEAAIAELEAQGWEVEHSGLSISGFPLRFDIETTELRATSPDGTLVWEAPSFQVSAASYRPNRVTATWPPDQRLAVAGQELDISAQGFEASATAGLSLDLPLEQAKAESGPATVAAEDGWSVALDRLLATAERTGSAVYETHVEVEGLHPAMIRTDIGLLRVDAQVSLDTPVELRDGAPPRFERLVLREARLAQGDVALTGTGELAPDAEGFLAGTVTLAAENWRGLLGLLEEAGLLAFDQRAFLEAALQEMARGGNRIEIPVTFANGSAQALGLFLFQAPRVR